MAENTFLTVAIKLKDDLSKGLKDVGSQMDKTAQSFKNDARQIADSLGPVGSALKALASPMAIVGAAAIAFGAAMRQGIREAAEFQEAMRFVAMQSQEAADQIDYLSKSISQMAPDMARSETDLARAMEAVADAGYSGAEAVKILEQASKLADATHTDLGATIDLVTKSMVALGISGGDAADYIEKLYKMSIAGIGNFQDLALVTEMLAGTFRTAGLSSDELLATVAHFSTIFPRSREAVMTLRAAIEAIRKPSEDAKMIAKELGIELSLTAMQAKGIGGYFAEMSQKAHGSTEALDTLLGSMGAWKAVAALSGEQGQKFAEVLANLSKQSQTLDDAHSRLMSSLSKQWQVFGQQINSIWRDMARGILPAIEQLVRWMNALAGAMRGINWENLMKAAQGGPVGYFGRRSKAS